MFEMIVWFGFYAQNVLIYMVWLKQHASSLLNHRMLAFVFLKIQNYLLDLFN
jgi:hypothetical protein